MLDDFQLKYFEEKFASVTKVMNMQHEANQKEFASIKDQTNKLENETKDIKRSLQLASIAEADHFIRCPLNKKIDDMETAQKKFKEQFEDASFFVRNPKLGMAIFLVAAFITSLGYTEFYNWQSRIDNKELKTTIQQKENKINSLENTIEAQDQLKP